MVDEEEEFRLKMPHSRSRNLDDLLIFIRLYNSQYETLLYIGHFLFSQQQSFRRRPDKNKSSFSILLFPRQMSERSRLVSENLRHSLHHLHRPPSRSNPYANASVRTNQILELRSLPESNSRSMSLGRLAHCANSRCQSDE